MVVLGSNHDEKDFNVSGMAFIDKMFPRPGARQESAPSIYAAAHRRHDHWATPVVADAAAADGDGPAPAADRVPSSRAAVAPPPPPRLRTGPTLPVADAAAASGHEPASAADRTPSRRPGNDASTSATVRAAVASAVSSLGGVAAL